MNVEFKNKKSSIPSLEIEEDDIPKAAELKLTMQTEGWRVFEELCKETREAFISDLKNAALMKLNDRDIAMKAYILLGFDVCLGRATNYIADAENLVRQNDEQEKEERENDTQ